MTSRQQPRLNDVGVLALVPDEWAGGGWQARHHVLWHLAKFFQVVWMNPARGWRELWLDQSVPVATPQPWSRPPGLTIYTPGKWVPQLYKPRALGEWTVRTRLRQARALLTSKGCWKIILYLWRPDYADASAQIRHDISCYHIDDEYSFSPVEQPLDLEEARLITSVDQVFIHSAPLWKEKGHLNVHTQFLPNGVNFQTYSAPHPEPADLQSISHPRIGYVGKVKTQLDFPLLLELSEKHPEWSFVFVGQEGYLGQDAPLLEQLRARSNVYMFGPRAIEELPGYVQHMDVCLLCYKINGYTKFIFPLKLNEYLAGGCPVVSTPLPSIAPFAHVVEMARTPQDWETAITRALTQEKANAQRIAERQHTAAPYDWNKLVNVLALRLCERLGPQYVEQFQQLSLYSHESRSTSHWLEQTLRHGLAVIGGTSDIQGTTRGPYIRPNLNSDPFSREASERPVSGYGNDDAAERARQAQALDRSLLKGIAWTGGVKWGVQVFSWISTLFVARLLTPDDYGLFGMAAVVLSFITLVNEFGLGAAIIARPDLTEAQVAQLNGFAVLLGIAGLSLTGLLAAPVAGYFGVPDVRGVLLALSGLLVLAGLRTVPASLLERDMQFKILALIEGGQSVVQAISAIVLALLGFGYWALVLSLVIGGSFSTGAVLFLHRHRIAWPQKRAIQQIVTTGWHLLVTRIVWYFSSSSDVLVAGRMLGATGVGTYTMAWSIAMVPVDKVTSLVGRVAFPLFASVQHDLPAMRRYLLSLTEGLALVTFPVACGLALVADDFVRLALGKQWHAVVVPLQLLTAFTAIRSITPLLPHILNVTNGTRFGMYTSVYAAALSVVAFYIGSFWGVAGIALAWVIVHPIVTAPLFVWVFRALQISVSDYLVAIYPAFSSTLVMAAILLGVRQLVPGDWLPIMRFSLLVALGGAAYAVTILLIHRKRVRTFFNIVRTAPA